MASSDSSTQQGENLFGLRSRQCFCGFRALVKTSWKYPNAGRRFYCCEKGRNGGCEYFDWADGEMCSRSQAIVPGLLNKCDRYEKKIAAMENERQHVEQEMRVLKTTKLDVEKGKEELEKEIKRLKNGKEELEKEIKRLKKEIRILYVLFAVCVVLLGCLSKVLYGRKDSLKMKQIR